MAKRMTRTERKERILQVLRENAEEGGNPLTCRQVSRKMGMTGFSYINQLLTELCDDGLIGIRVRPSKKSVSNVRFTYYV